MIKITKNICRRALILTAEIVGALIALILVATCALFWRLSEGPLEVQFIVPYVEDILADKQEGVRFDVSKAQLELDPEDKSLALNIEDVGLFITETNPVAVFPKIELLLTFRSVFLGPLMPESITFFDPALRVTRLVDGNFAFNLGQDIDSIQSDQAVDTSLIQKLLRDLSKGEKKSVSGIEHIQISNAAVIYEDKEIGTVFNFPRVNLLVSQDQSGVRGKLELDLMLNKKPTTLNGRVLYNRQSNETGLFLNFKDFNLLALSRKADALGPLGIINAPVSGKAEVRFEDKIHLASAVFDVSTGAGTFDFKPLYEEALTVEKASFKLIYDRSQSRVDISDINIDVGAGIITGKGDLYREEDVLKTRISALLTGFDFNLLNQYWPSVLAVPARNWVIGHLFDADVSSATLEVKGHTPIDDIKAFKVDTLGGEIDFTNMRVDYLPPLPPVTGAIGKAVYDLKKFDIAVSSGKLLDMDVGTSNINISGFGNGRQNIDIDVSLSGPLATALYVLEQEPLGYPKKLGIQTNKVQGRADVDVNFKFPLRKGLTLGDVKITAEAKLNDILFPALFSGLDVSGGPLLLNVTDEDMKVSGQARLSGVPTDLTWATYFSTAAPYKSDLQARLLFGPQLQSHFGISLAPWVQNPVPVDIAYKEKQDKTATLTVQGDLGPTVINIEKLNYTKPVSTAGSAKFAVGFGADGHPKDVKNIRVNSEALDVQGEGTLGKSPDGKINLKTLKLSQFHMGRTQASLDLKTTPNKGFDIAIQGSMFDAGYFFRKNKNQDLDPSKTPVILRMDVARLYTKDENALDGFKFFMNQDDNAKIQTLEIDGKVGAGDLYLRFLPETQDPALRLEIRDVGTVFKALDITNKIKGGNLIAIGRPDKESQGMEHLRGRIWMSEFVVVKAPALARLLNAMSLNGFQELLSGEGIRFAKLRSKYSWLNKPEEKTKKLGFHDGNTSGSALGLTFDGTLDIVREGVDMRGTIVPISPVNKALSALPVIGEILSGGEDSVFAATYAMKGLVKDPSITVNPLAVLAPGFLRKLFSSETDASDEAPPSPRR